MAYERRMFRGAAAKTTLASGINAADASFTVASGGGAGYPDGATGNFFVCIDRTLSTEEKILCSARSSDTFTVAASGRGKDNTTAAAHSSGAFVEHVVTAQDLDEANLTVNQTTGAVTTKGDLLAATGANVLARRSGGSNDQFFLADSAQATGVKWGAIPSGAISAAAMFGTGVVPATAIQSAAWSTYVPVLSGAGWAIVDGTITGRYLQLGRFVPFKILVTFGPGSTYGAGAPILSLPVAGTTGVGDLRHAHVRLFDATSTEFLGAFERASSTTISITYLIVSAGAISWANVTSALPFTWATTDRIEVQGFFESAA